MDLTKLAEDLIEKSFPELRQRRFRVEISDSVPDDSLSAASLLRTGDFLVLVNTLLRNCPEESLKLYLAHELAHMTRSVRRWRVTEKISKILYSRSRLYSMYEEYKANQLAASRGYKSPMI